jgi:predicted acyltransferase
VQRTRFSRLLSLDIFRGLTVALMIIVNSPGNQLPYAWLEHSAWDGCTLADLVFPFFIYIVGISLVFPLEKAKQKGRNLKELLPSIYKRTLTIFFLGVLLNAFPYHFDVSTLRFYGVLQRIALCYFAASLLYLTTSIRFQIILIVSILIGYWLIMVCSLPGLNTYDLSPAGNVGAHLDRILFSAAHLYGKTFDPEGLLSTLPALATALLGTLTGVGLLSAQSDQVKLKMMILAGVLMILMGWLWGMVFPINKALWTSSYVLWTGGIGLLCFALCYWLIEIKAWRKGIKPFQLLGTYALLAYILHVFFLKLQFMIKFEKADGTLENLKFYLCDHLFGWASAPNASLLYSISYVLFWIIVLTILSKRSSSRVH